MNINSWGVCMQWIIGYELEKLIDLGLISLYLGFFVDTKSWGYMKN